MRKNQSRNSGSDKIPAEIHNSSNRWSSGSDQSFAEMEQELKVLLRNIKRIFLRQQAPAEWEKTFPDEFYRLLYELKGWTFDADTFHHRPAVVGKYTNEIIYERIAPGLLKELKRLNPSDENGNRAVRHFQWLTRNHGLVQLEKHLEAIIALMRVAPDWGHFLELVRTAYPKPGEQLIMRLGLPQQDRHL